jgi:pimeloyl-ACP methyl ester carboxylesterase
VSAAAPRAIELALPHLTLRALAWGTGRARVLALHGWLDNAASFCALAPLLDDVELVAIDLPGHGLSDHRAAGAYYHYVDYLGDVLGAADALGWDRFTLLGHSLGAAIGSVLAAAAPQRVAQAWLVEGLGPIATPESKALELLRQALRDREAIAAKSLRVFERLDVAVAARMQANGLSEAAARALVERGTRRTEGGHVWSSDPRLTLTSAIRLTEAQILAYLGGIACPTLLVLADPSPPYFTPETVERRCAVVAGIERVVLPGTHHLHLEDPAPVAAAIAAFRARHPAAG